MRNTPDMYNTIIDSILNFHYCFLKALSVTMQST